MSVVNLKLGQKLKNTRAEDIWIEVPASIEVEDELVGCADHSDIEAGLKVQARFILTHDHA